MDYQSLYQTKLINPEDAVAKVKSGDNINYLGTSAEPFVFMKNLMKIKDQVKGVTIYNTLPMFEHEIYSQPNIQENIKVESQFFSRFYSPLQKKGVVSFTPCHLRNCGRDIFDKMDSCGEALNIYVATVRPMDKNGYFSTGTVCLYTRDAIKRADMVILEINECVPYTYGDSYIHISEVDYIYPGNNEMIYLPKKKDVDDDDIAIGRHIAGLINDGDTLQLGIGGIPNAVAIELKDKKDLGIHTEMLNDAIVNLYKQGVVNNSKKTLYKDLMVTTFTMGNKETYDFLDFNPGVLHLNVHHVNNPFVIAQNKNMISVNTTLQIDLMGQCASEAIGTNQISGSGGQLDTAVGAKLAENGRSVIALHSTAMVKNENGERECKSTIVPVHPAGTVITLPRADTDFVVTEFGYAALRGRSLKDRAKALIKIAHPDFRAELEEEAQRYFLL